MVAKHLGLHCNRILICKLNLLLTQQEYIKASKLYSKYTAKEYFVFIVYVIASLAFAFTNVKQIYQFMAIGGSIGAIAGYVIVRHIYAPLVAKRQYQEYRAKKAPISIYVSSTGIRFESESGQSNIEWKRIIKWRQNEQLILICGSFQTASLRIF